MLQFRLRWLLLLLCFGLTLGLSLGAICADGDRGAATGHIIIDDCGGEVYEDQDFDLDPDFFAAQRFDQQFDIRMQNGGKPFDLSDSIYFQIIKVDEISENVTLPIADKENIRASLNLFETCSSSTSGLSVTGEINFKTLNTKPDRRLAAEFVLYIYNGRNFNEQVGYIVGYFNFIIKIGSPYTVID